jgi:putative FmdB family regulatory protein
MPLYEYYCVDCHTQDTRVAALDDHTARCTRCGGLMFRLDADVFGPYFSSGRPVVRDYQPAPHSPACPWCGDPHQGTFHICATRAAELRQEVPHA